MSNCSTYWGMSDHSGPHRMCDSPDVHFPALVKLFCQEALIGRKHLRICLQQWSFRVLQENPGIDPNNIRGNSQ